MIYVWTTMYQRYMSCANEMPMRVSQTEAALVA